MDSARKGILVTALATVLSIGSMVFNLIQGVENEVSRLDGTTIRCIIELKNYNDTSATLITGFNYHLLKQFAKERGFNAEIRLSDRMLSGLDSLRSGNIDLLVVPYNKKKHLDSILVSHPVDSHTVWMLRHDWHKEMREINHWIRDVHGRADFDSTRSVYMSVYSPFRSRPRKVISPYDSLIINYSDSIGWDWRLMSALVYQESHFHIEARSPRGAMGLMQMMPSTAAHFGADDLLDPEESISAGARYLELLSARYKNLAADKDEQTKYVLAAYNAGGGRIRDCILFARSMGIEPSRWDDITGIIPMMRDSASVAQVEGLKSGTFRGNETIHYVDRVMSLYREFCRIAPARK